MNLLDAIEGEGWSIQQAIQTTFPFDPQFYSGYVRPRLHRRNCDLPLVLIDGGRYEREITSSDWREAPIGTDYLLEPVDTNGVFHPKINLFASERSVFFSVSSANLTLEEYSKAAQIGYADGFQKAWATDDERDIGEAYYLARDVRDFYTELLEQDGLITGQDATNYVTETAATLEWLEDVESDIDTPASDRTTRLVSNLSSPILAQVVEQVGDIDRAQLYAPFYGTPNVVRRIADRLDANQLELLVESESTALDVMGLPEALADLEYDVRKIEMEKMVRWIHAKFLVLEGEWGQACLFGSPNMTSSALLESAAGGNVEAGLLTETPPGSDETALQRALFQSDAFEFDVSAPVTDLSSLDLRSASYEGWESIRKGERDAIRLEDARLTQPGADDESDLILTLSDVTGKHEFTVSTEGGEEKIQTGVIDGDNDELSITIGDGERVVWADAVVVVEAGERSSNPRRVVEEKRAYYREYREITQSGGTRSSNTLLREILQNPDTAAISTFDFAISELQRAAKQATSPAGAVSENANESYPERSPPNLTSTSRSLPSLATLVKRHLAYHREQAVSALDMEDQPRPDDVHAFVDHARTFWETIELCFVLERTGQLDSGRIDDAQLFSVCMKQLQKWFSRLYVSIQRLNGIVNQVENTESVQDAFLERSGIEVFDLDIWESVSEVVFLHPGIVLEFETSSEHEVIRSKNGLANKMYAAFDDIPPHVGQHLLDGENLVERIELLRGNLAVEFETSDDRVELSGRGIQVLVLYILVQKIAKDDTFISGLRGSPRFTDGSVVTLVRFALQADEAIVEYGLVNDLGWSIVLQTPRRELEEISSGSQ